MDRTIRSLALAGLALAGGAARAYSTHDGAIYDPAQQPVQLRGVNWFGFEGQDHVAHGLWTRNWKDMVAQMKTVGFNAVRIPVCPGTLHGSGITSVDFNLNPDLAGKNSLQALDLVLAEFDRQGFYILLDHHRPDCYGDISELWYTNAYSQQSWLDDLRFMAQRYQMLPHLIGIDIKNEPHGAATWGVGNPATDWNTAAETAAAALQAVAPELLIFVEGIQENPGCSGPINHWWGGNLEPLACHPLAIPADRLVLSPHVYGPDVYAQPYFSASNFPANLPAIWDAHFGQFRADGYTLAIGETGGRYGHGGDAKDKPFQDALVDYLIAKDIQHLFYWSWNPNSGDTGGILQDDWRNVWQDKLDLLHRLWNGGGPAACADGLDNDGDGWVDYPADPGCSSSTDSDETDPPPPTACADGLDNDGDGRVDYPADPGCASATDSDETDPPPPPPAACADGLDNDGDGRVDYPADPGCASSTDGDEYNAPLPPTRLELPVSLSIASDWGAGYCANATVTNGTDHPVEWTTHFQVQGIIRNLWNANYSQTGGNVDASGLEWNKVLNPGAAASFGFCADRPAPKNACEDGLDNDGDGLTDYPGDPGCGSATDNDETNPAPGAVMASLNLTTDWGAGYCANVDVKNSGPLAVAWQVGLNIEGRVYTLWNAVHTQTGGTLQAQGVAWNRLVPGGGTVQFGFCANR
ncbi:glycoside hydrolase family 5 protein [Methylomagnum ishizawai]|uniref:glycoside hydrolase family 5 protein n=1 Tax=Methylomagnum ishizawai TaxID=1760988 RepID=UPI001C326C8D|nr:glycoside hydrolase family 5 protein [Methylomagnum ishizawai]BBL76354.1 hypothetical protein MishRS11D_34520 [Methylomagnum ishizawai]